VGGGGGRPQSLIGSGVPLVMLGVFKYFNFFISSFADAFGIQSITTLRIILPVGISFYTFQALSYVLDVSQHKIAAEKNFRKLALYISFFPQLVAGPIIKAADFLPQLDEERNVTIKNISTGMQIFVFGLFKKVVIADWLSVFVDDVFLTPKAFHAVSLILGVMSYSIQIYFDFSGYSDMAVGCAKCLGYDFMRNFNMPYISRNIREFWQRWHISLSSWLKQYLYIPLGGNRKGAARTYFNNMITMLLGGLWHGAAWTFAVWGALHGIALCVHKYYKQHFYKQHHGKNTAVGLVSIVLTNIFVAFCWIFFRADTFETARDLIYGIITWQEGIVQIYAWTIPAVFLVLLGTVYAVIKNKNHAKIDGIYPILNLSSFWQLVIFFVEIGLIIGVGYTGANPFIYFQF
jgi:alginate O-acetyltransferase complex protein AlgI